MLKGKTGHRVVRCLVQNVSAGGFRVVSEPYHLADQEFTLTLLDSFEAEVRAVWNDAVHIGFAFAVQRAEIPESLRAGYPVRADSGHDHPRRRRTDR